MYPIARLAIAVVVVVVIIAVVVIIVVIVVVIIVVVVIVIIIIVVVIVIAIVARYLHLKLKVVILWAANDSKARDPRPLVSTVRLISIKGHTIKWCAFLCLSAAQYVAFHAYHSGKNLKSSLLGTTSYFGRGLSGSILVPC